MVVKHDHMIQYWATEEDYKAGKKPRGTISLCGYSVNRDANDTLINRLKKLAEKMGMNFDDLPKPKEYPKGTIEIHHERRQAFYINFENDDDVRITPYFFSSFYFSFSYHILEKGLDRNI